MAPSVAIPLASRVSPPSPVAGMVDPFTRRITTPRDRADPYAKGGSVAGSPGGARFSPAQGPPLQVRLAFTPHRESTRSWIGVWTVLGVDTLASPGHVVMRVPPTSLRQPVTVSGSTTTRVLPSASVSDTVKWLWSMALGNKLGKSWLSGSSGAVSCGHPVQIRVLETTAADAITTEKLVWTHGMPMRPA